MKKVWSSLVVCIVTTILAFALFGLIKKLNHRVDEATLSDNRKSDSGLVETIVERPADQRERDDQLYKSHRKWLGTPWDFNGTSQVAGKGEIACGYFVTTTLEQSGMELDRVRLAQAASETMILELADRDSVRRYSNASLTKVISTIRSQGEGYYIVGLDDHTGFLKVDSEGRVVFIHSGPGKGVVIETPEDSHRLSSSRYRVTGKVIW